jgi:hypothetical protein
LEKAGLVYLFMEDLLKQQTIYGASLLSIDKFQLDINKSIYEQWQEVITNYLIRVLIIIGRIDIVYNKRF